VLHVYFFETIEEMMNPKKPCVLMNSNIFELLPLILARALTYPPCQNINLFIPIEKEQDSNILALYLL